MQRETITSNNNGNQITFNIASGTNPLQNNVLILNSVPSTNANGSILLTSSVAPRLLSFAVPPSSLESYLVVDSMGQSQSNSNVQGMSSVLECIQNNINLTVPLQTVSFLSNGGHSQSIPSFQINDNSNVSRNRQNLDALQNINGMIGPFQNDQGIIHQNFDPNNASIPPLPPITSLPVDSINIPPQLSLPPLQIPSSDSMHGHRPQNQNQNISTLNLPSNQLQGMESATASTNSGSTSLLPVPMRLSLPTSVPGEFTCKHCDSRFPAQSQLTQHLKTHSKEKRFHCPYTEICNKSFRQKHSLNEHIRVHTGEKPFECDLCSKAFRIKSNMKVHRRIHTGEKPYLCTECFKRFSSKSGLNSHMKHCHQSRENKRQQAIH